MEYVTDSVSCCVRKVRSHSFSGSMVRPSTLEVDSRTPRCLQAHTMLHFEAPLCWAYGSKTMPSKKKTLVFVGSLKITNMHTWILYVYIHTYINIEKQRERERELLNPNLRKRGLLGCQAKLHTQKWVPCS